MKPRFVAVAALALFALSGCVDPSHATEADELKSALEAMPGVQQVSLTYTEPVVLDSAKLSFNVEMDDDASADAVAAVVEATYEAFQDVHRGEEGDLYVTAGDDTVHLRSFSPKATTGAVAEAAVAALNVVGEGGVLVDINTQDVEKAPHVETALLVTIDEAGPSAVLKTLTNLRRTWADVANASWGVTSSDDWTLGSTSGFPTAAARTNFEELSSDVPKGGSIEIVNRYVNVRVSEKASSDDVSSMFDRHLRALGGIENISYDLTHGDYFYVLISPGDCTFSADAIGQRLKDEHGGNCAKVTTSEG